VSEKAVSEVISGFPFWSRFVRRVCTSAPKGSFGR